jgi:hypothetical protein
MPTPAITTLRATVAAALTNAGVWSTFDFPPATILANSCIVAPDDPYLETSNNSQSVISPKVNLKIILCVPMFDNKGNLNGIEDFIVQAFNKLSASAIVFNITSVSAPTVLNAASGDLLMADMSITVLSTWE